MLGDMACLWEEAHFLDAQQLSLCGPRVGKAAELVPERLFHSRQAHSGDGQCVEQHDAGVLVPRVAGHSIGREGHAALHQIGVEARCAPGAQNVAAVPAQQTTVMLQARVFIASMLCFLRLSLALQCALCGCQLAGIYYNVQDMQSTSDTVLASSVEVYTSRGGCPGMYWLTASWTCLVPQPGAPDDVKYGCVCRRHAGPVEGLHDSWTCSGGLLQLQGALCWPRQRLGGTGRR